ncbi:MAG: deoC [Oscillospiraceae bacterium]|nr:deoC [Oscillospiraceae bacterium]
MTLEEILPHVDHTLLRQTATWEEIRALCDQGMACGTASVCIPPSYVRQASEYLDGRLPVCTVIGFPNGYYTTAVKVFEARQAIADGADELDMVINLGWVKDGRWDDLLEEIRLLCRECSPEPAFGLPAPCGEDETAQSKAYLEKPHLLKVIVETCLLTEEEKRTLCRIVGESGADFIKTSTGFSGGGATVEDVALFRQHLAPGVKIKAAGGIRTLEDAEAMLRAGADRLGSSALANH